jgi:hypothetical protein
MCRTGLRLWPLGLALMAGCAAPQWPTAQEEVAVWLTEQPRQVAVRVSPDLPAPSVLVRDHKAGERIGKGAVGGLAGAGLTIYAGCHGGPFGCLLGVMAAPVGAVVGVVHGAVSVDSVDVPHPIVEAQGAPELYQRAVNGEQLQALFSQALIAESDKARGDGPRLAEHADGEGTLSLTLRGIDLFGDVGENPSVALRLRAYADVKTPEAIAHAYAEAIYEGSRRPISEWRADGAKLFREELSAAAREIAEKTVRRLRSAPPSAAFRKVAHARERQREAAAAAAAAPAPVVDEPAPRLVAESARQMPTELAAASPMAQFEETARTAKPRTVLEGALWEYAFEDQLFSGRRHRFSVRAEAVEGDLVLESLQDEAGARGSERVPSHGLAFRGRPVLDGDSLLELGPYMPADERQLEHNPAAYPLGGSSEPWRIRTRPVIQEEVSVQAGTFAALRVEVNGERSHAGFAGLSGGLMNTLGVTRFRYTAWYVPEVGRYVKARHEQWNPSGSLTADELVQLVAYRAP